MKNTINVDMLKAVKKELLGTIERKPVDKYDYALCNASKRVWGKFDENTREFKNYLMEANKNKKVFYMYDGKKIDDIWSFHWLPKNYKSRVNWLDKHIKLNSI